MTDRRPPHDLPSPARDPAEGELRQLLDIMAALRTPGSGCPWDLEQTFATIAPYTIEEAYEVADAIQRGDALDLRDELGDLLLQVVYHARMAEERGLFDFADVAAAISAKMVRRHPHVFGSEDQRADGPVTGSWDTIKAAERAAKNQERANLPAAKRSLASQPDANQPASTTSENQQPSLLDDVPVALPALARAIKLQHKAAAVGFDWPSLAPVMAKMKEELAELEAALMSDADETAQRTEIEEEFGDLLFVMANVARHLKFAPEDALQSANAKFVRRFAHIERKLAAAGRTPEDATLDEMDALWDDAKRQEKLR